MLRGDGDGLIELHGLLPGENAMDALLVEAGGESISR